jgi:hypothetical protein
LFPFCAGPAIPVNEPGEPERRILHIAVLCGAQHSFGSGLPACLVVIALGQL